MTPGPTHPVETIGSQPPKKRVKGGGGSSATCETLQLTATKSASTALVIVPCTGTCGLSSHRSFHSLCTSVYRRPSGWLGERWEKPREGILLDKLAGAATLALLFHELSNSPAVQKCIGPNCFCFRYALRAKYLFVFYFYFSKIGR